MGVKHKFVSTKTDGPDPDKVQHGPWNDDHAIDLRSTLQGSGIDGAVHFDGVSTVLGVAFSGGKYTLSRDIYPSAMIVDAGVQIDAANWRIFVAGKLTNNGHIHNDGGAAAQAVAGGSKSTGFFPATCAGGAAAGPATGAGSDGTASTAALPAPFCITGAGAAGGATNPGTPGTAGAVACQGGGAGGYSGDAGGVGGGVTASALAAGAALDDLIAGRSASRGIQFTGGSGGGGGAAAHSTGIGVTGGAGGAGAGWLVVVCAELAGTGTITCVGGVAANAAAVGGGLLSEGTASGGGGGGGGVLVVVYSTNSGPNTFSVSGGAAGSKAGTAPIGGGGDGGAGHAGILIRVNLNNDGT